MNPKGIAPKRTMKKGGRAAVIPLGEFNPPPAPCGAELGVSDFILNAKSIFFTSPNFKSPNLKSIICKSSKCKLELTCSVFFLPPYNPPSRSAHSAGSAKTAHKIRLLFHQNFDRFWTSILGRFGVVLGRPGFAEAPGLPAVLRKINKFKSELQKASKTLKIADMDKSQRHCPKTHNEKKRAGGGDPPWGIR